MSTTDDPPRRRRGRPSNVELAIRSAVKPRVRGGKRGRPSKADIAARSRLSAASSLASFDSLANFDDDGDDALAAHDFQHLAPVIRRIPQHVIDTQWTALPPRAINRLEELMEDVQRAVVMRIDERTSDARERQAWSTGAIEQAMRRLRKQMRRGQKFPRSTRPTREDDFDFEKTLDINRSIESQLTPTLHSIELLKAEMAREQALLTKEREQLKKLEDQAKLDASRRQKSDTQLHAILRRDHGPPPADAIATVSSPRISLAEVAQHPDAEPTITQLSHHIRSIKNNQGSVDGLAAAMARTQAMLQDVLSRQLDVTQYEHVVLG